MEKVTGLGGVFWRAEDPDALAEWYRSRLGIEDFSTDYPVWRQKGGPTILAPFRRTTTYFADERQQVMLTFRVRDLDAMAAQLRPMGEEVGETSQDEVNGRFARLHDPEGNALELWEPMGAALGMEER